MFTSDVFKIPTEVKNADGIHFIKTDVLPNETELKDLRKEYGDEYTAVLYGPIQHDNRLYYACYIIVVGGKSKYYTWGASGNWIIREVILPPKNYKGDHYVSSTKRTS